MHSHSLTQIENTWQTLSCCYWNISHGALIKAEQQDSEHGKTQSWDVVTEAGASVYMQARARVALAVVWASRVHTSVLAASIMDLALINICEEGGREEEERQKQEEKWEQFHSILSLCSKTDEFTIWEKNCPMILGLRCTLRRKQMMNEKGKYSSSAMWLKQTNPPYGSNYWTFKSKFTFLCFLSESFGSGEHMET